MRAAMRLEVLARRAARMAVLEPGSALVAAMARRRAKRPSARRVARGPAWRAATGAARGLARHADRLNGHSVQHKALPSKGSLSKLVAAATAMEDEMEEDEEEEKVVDKKRVEALQERRCDSRGRGGVYDPVLGICCHFCRQKKLCGEEDCKRCGEGDLKQPCLGKTECSSCHSSNGILCRACLKVRYGEEMEEVRKNKNWMCPHCIEEKGIKKFWICNRNFWKQIQSGIAQLLTFSHEMMQLHLLEQKEDNNDWDCHI